MKIRHPWLIRAFGCVGAHVLRQWTNTLHFEYRPLGADVNPHRPDLAGRYIYAMWHEYMLLPIAFYTRPDVHVLISRHADGQILADLCRSLGIPVVRGSTTRGGVQAVRELLTAGLHTHLALAPDGPRGPRQRIQRGLAYLASRTGLPIVPVGFGLDQPRRLRSWDSFAIPHLWSRARCVTGAPIVVPPHADANQLELYRLRAEEALSQATGVAEQWAETGTWPGVRSQESGIGSQESGVSNQADRLVAVDC